MDRNRITQEVVVVAPGLWRMIVAYLKSRPLGDEVAAVLLHEASKCQVHTVSDAPTDEKEER